MMESTIRNAVTLRPGAGDQVIRQGSRGEYIYHVLEGELQAVLEHPVQGEVVLGQIGRGEFFGEMAVLSGKSASAHVYARTSCELLALDKEQFFELLEQDSELNRSFLATLSLRASTMLKLEQRRAVFLLIQAIGENVDLRGLTQRLLPRLKTMQDCHAVRNKAAQELSLLDIQAHLAKLQEQHDLVVLVQEENGPDWWKIAGDRLGKVLLVGNGLDQPPSKPLPPLPVEVPEQPLVELALLHPKRKRPPQSTKAWLEQGNYRMHYHIVPEDAEDLDRLGRCLTGNAVGLVCSGGGARGMAHVGLIFALREAGVPIDFLIGTSAGAMLPAIYPMGWTKEKTYVLADTIRRFRRRIKDYTLPITSLFAGKAMTRMIKEFTGDWQVEDLWIPYAAVSTSLKTGKPVVMREGPLWRAIRASASLPVVMPPMVMDDDVLVDGGLVNNSPVDLAYLFPKGKIIFSDISKLSHFEFEARLPEYVSGWRLFFQRLNPFSRRQKPPSITRLMSRSFELMYQDQQRRAIERRPPDLHISLPIKEFGLQDYGSMEAIMEKSYAFAQEHMPAWKQALELDS